MNDQHQPQSISTDSATERRGGDPSVLSEIHRNLLEQLSILDRIGEHIVAAHLAAAIDALEYRIDSFDGKSRG